VGSGSRSGSTRKSTGSCNIRKGDRPSPAPIGEEEIFAFKRKEKGGPTVPKAGDRSLSITTTGEKRPKIKRYREGGKKPVILVS